MNCIFPQIKLATKRCKEYIEFTMYYVTEHSVNAEKFPQ